MKHNQGFTLIELIIVIVILGILAVTAAPKFLDFGSDARESTLTGVKGALESAGSLVYGKAIIAGDQNEPTAELEDLGGVDIVFGYPAATADALRAAAELDEGEWDMAAGSATNDPNFDADRASVVITPNGVDAAATAADACQVVYREATATGTPAVITKPTITVYSEGC